MKRSLKNSNSSQGLSSPGLILIDELSKKINASIHFENTPHKETVAVLTL